MGGDDQRIGALDWRVGVEWIWRLNDNERMRDMHRESESSWPVEAAEAKSILVILAWAATILP